MTLNLLESGWILVKCYFIKLCYLIFCKVTAAGDQTAKFWDVKAGELIGTCKGHQCSLKSVAFSKFEKGRSVPILFHVLNLLYGELIRSFDCLHPFPCQSCYFSYIEIESLMTEILHEIKLTFSPILVDIISSLFL